MATLTSTDRKSWALFLSTFLGWLVAYFTARWLLKNAELETWLRVTIALVPVPLFALFLAVFIRNIRGMDELERKIQLEALGIAFPLAMLLLMTLALLQRAIDLPFEDWSYAHVWFYLPIFYLFGVAYSARRYQ